MRVAIEWDMEAGKIAEFIKDTLGSYAKLSDKLHASAIMAFVHAANHGDAQYLTALYDGLRENDSNMLKAWLLKFSTYTDVVGGEEVRKQWVGHRSVAKDAKHPAGFFVKPKTEGVRKDKFDPAEMWQGEAFFDTADKPGKPMTLEAILTFLSKIESGLDKKGEQAAEQGNDAKVDGELVNLAHDLSAKAAMQLAALKAAKPANVQAA